MEWKPQLLTQAVGVCGGTTKATMDALDLQVLHAKIGPLVLEHDILEGARSLRRASLDGRRETIRISFQQSETQASLEKSSVRAVKANRAHP